MLFIQQHHGDYKYIFWPDLSPAHYAKTVLSFFDKNKVQYVAKTDNPQNLPEVAQLKIFGVFLKEKSTRRIGKQKLFINFVLE